MMINFLLSLTTVCIGLLVGVEFAVSAFVNPVLWTLEPSAQSAAIRLFARKLGRAMPPWYIASFVLLVIAAIAQRHQPAENPVDRRRRYLGDRYSAYHFISCAHQQSNGSVEPGRGHQRCAARA